MKLRYALVVLVVVVIVGVGVALPLVPRLYCEARGGHWRPYGPSGRPECSPPTADGGKICSSSSECEGSCIAILSPEDLDRARMGEIVRAEGKCSIYRIVIGCLPFVENVTVRILCVD